MAHDFRLYHHYIDYISIIRMNFSEKQFIGYLKDKDKQEIKRPVLKIKEDNSSIIIQTENIALEVIFNTPILNVLEYLEQHQKYNYRAALSSINLKVQQFDTYYTAAKDKVEHLYNTLAYKSMKVIEDLLISLKVAKIQAWREQAMPAHILKNYLYQKNLCPYNFNPKQFEPDRNQLLTIVSQNKTKPDALIKIVNDMSKKMKQIEAAKMQQMFSGKVISPYLAQNKYNEEVDPSKMYSSLLKQLSIKMERSDESLFYRFYSINGEVMKYTQYLHEHCVRTQKMTINLIKRYNEQYGASQVYKDYISPPPLLTFKKKFNVQQDCLHLGKQKWSELKLSLLNKQQKLEFKGFNRVVDMQTNHEQVVQHKQEQQSSDLKQDQKGKLSYGYSTAIQKHQPFQLFGQQRRINYKQFYYFKEYQKQKYKEEEMHHQQKYREREASSPHHKNKRMVKVHQYTNQWIQYFKYQYAFAQLHSTRLEKQVQIYDYIKQHENIQKRNDIYQNEKVKKDKKVMPYYTLMNEQKTKIELNRKKISQQQTALKDENHRIDYEKKKRQEEKTRMVRYNHMYKKRTYQKFMAMSKLEIQGDDLQESFLHRYGLNIMRHLRSETNFKELDKFFYYFFKEKYYRQNEFIKENTDNPIVFMDSSKVNMEASQKIVAQLINSIVKRIATMPFFIIWSEDLFIYKLVQTKEDKCGQITIYPLGNISNMQKLVYQIRRRVKMRLKEQIFYDYKDQNEKAEPNEFEKISNKVEIVHRSIYQRHLLFKDGKRSAEKGEQLMSEIIGQFEQW